MSTWLFYKDSHIKMDDLRYVQYYRGYALFIFDDGEWTTADTTEEEQEELKQLVRERAIKCKDYTTK